MRSHGLAQAEQAEQAQLKLEALEERQASVQSDILLHRRNALLAAQQLGELAERLRGSSQSAEIKQWLRVLGKSLVSRAALADSAAPPGQA